ncbi:MAG: division/cell wall cluster transcriptional repressor MraZ [Deltaproteobacteria bacterium]|nr:division/cell wall cluster transcriptional repressor MraZ [Deltaproteobacteria bacterium]
MFRGRYEHAIDGKGRTSLPSRFREVLAAKGEAHLVVTTGLSPCLVAYPVQEWERFEERLSALSQFDERVAMLRRVYVSGAVECEVDKLGRLLIPANLRRHAGLKQELIWAGMGRNLEIWSKTRFNKLCNDVLKNEEARREIASHLAQLGL